MKERQTVFTDVVLRLARDVTEARARADESQAAPLMHQRVKARDEARRVAAMTPGELRAFHGRVGTARIVEALQRAWQEAQRGRS